MDALKYGFGAQVIGGRGADHFELMATFGVLGADSNLDAFIGIDQPLARGVIKHAAVVVYRIVFLVGIGMCVEMYHRKLTELTMMRA